MIVITQGLFSDSRIKRSSLWLAILLLAVLIEPASRGRVSSAATPAAPPVSLRGEEAVAQLKQQGSYDSLAAAMTATCYQVRQIARPGFSSSGAWRAVNAAQQIKTDFTSGSVRIAQHDKPAEQPDALPGWQFAMKLTAFGYGDRLLPVSEGEVTADGPRVELARTALADASAKITEWYVNKAKGLEQGFTLDAPPLALNVAGEKLRLRLALTGDLRAKLSSDGQSVALLDRRGAQVLSYGGLVVRDALGRELEARMVASDNEVVIEADDAGAIYPVVIDPVFTQFNKLIPNDRDNNDFFGDSVALSGDTALVGATLDNIGQNAGQGSAYVFVRSGTTWIQQQKLVANDGGANEYFGVSVALSGDTALIGARADNINANTGQGSAYVFVRSGTTWTQQQKLTDSDGAATDNFGCSVAVDGNTGLIGAFGDDINGNVDRGSASVFVRSGSVWTQQQKLTANDGVGDDAFGRAVALSGDTALVGASSDDVNANADQGSAYVFVRSGTTWTQQQKLTASDGAASDFFGTSVALDGNTALIGSVLDDVGGNANQGSAYIFVRNGTTWTQQQQLTASDGAAGDDFGWSVVLSGDMALIGANFDDIGGNANQGSAYVFVRSGTTWTQQQKLTANDGAAQDGFGKAVALSSDTALVTGGVSQAKGAAYQFSVSSIFPQQAMLAASDGAASDNFGRALALSGDTAVVGNYGDDIAGVQDRGSAYVFVRNGTTWTQQQQLVASDGVAGDLFGSAVAVDGNTALIGAFGDDDDGNPNIFDKGSAYVFVRSGTTWTQQRKLLADDGGANDLFGFAVALSGETALVGAYGQTFINASSAGAAYVFVRSGTNWTQQQKLTADVRGQGDVFGAAVALDANTALIGAGGNNSARGAAYVFVRGGATWTQQQKLTASDAAPSDSFGVSVAVRGDTALVGALYNDIGANGDQGSAYVFVRTGTNWTQQQKLTASDGFAGDNFGVGVALDGDTAVIGAWYDDINGNADQGSAYVFIRNGTVWTQQQKLFASDGAGGDLFGYAVSLSGGKALVGSLGHEVNATLDQGSAYVFGVNCPVITITPTSLPVGMAGTPYSQSLTGGGGASPYSFTVITGALPNGVSLSGGGFLSGTPTAFGSFNFTVRATDNNGCQGTQSYTLQINPPCGTITVNPSSLPNGAVGTAYNQTVTATGGTAAYAFTISAGSLPGGLSLASGGALTGTPNAAGTFNFTIKATDANGCMGTHAYTLTVTGGGGSASLQFYPLPRPVRILDTRANQGNCDNVSTPISGETSIAALARLTCEGITIPDTAKAITGNVTVLNQTNQIGYMTVYPDGQAAPVAANMIYAPNDILANNFTVGLSTDGKFDIFGERTIHAVVDVSGYYAPPASGGLYYHPLPKPVRLLDTRANQGNCDNVATPISAGTSLTTLARTTCEGVTIPAAAQAIVGNATVINGSGQLGYLTIYPNGVSAPLAANLIYFPGKILSNAFTVSLDASGNFNIFGEKTIDIVVDVAGYYSSEATDANGAGLLLTPLSRPLRILDTRANAGNCDNVSAPITGGSSIAAAGRLTCETLMIPTAAQAILGNVTVINQTNQAGFLTLYPDGVAQPLAANVIYFPNQILSNSFVVGLSTGTGQFRIFAERTLDVVVDAAAYFAP